MSNLEHEVNTAIIGITLLEQVLYENYDKLTDTQLYEGVKNIANSSERLRSLVENLLNLSKLNLSELIHSSVKICSKLYLNSKELKIISIIQPDIEINCDKRYITYTIDNLIINAIRYSNKGEIIIKLSKMVTEIEFSIEDKGIGIPHHELYNIFSTFVVSSRTRTTASGRGIDLALCQKVIKVHIEEIWAENGKEEGAIFRFKLPIEV